MYQCPRPLEQVHIMLPEFVSTEVEVYTEMECQWVPKLCTTLLHTYVHNSAFTWRWAVRVLHPLLDIGLKVSLDVH